MSNSTKNIPDQAYNLFMDEKYKEGINLLEEYIKNNEATSNIFNNLGLAYMILDNLDEAEKNLKKALEFKNLPYKLYYNFAELYVRKGNYIVDSNQKLAKNYFLKALENINIYLSYDKVNEYAINLKRNLEKIFI